MRPWTTSLLILLFTSGPSARTEDGRSPPKATVFKDGVRSAEFEIDHDAGRVLRRDSGVKTWSTYLEGYLGQVRQPNLVWDAHRVFVTHQDGVTALDAGTGKVLWHANGPGDRLLLSGGLLLATDGGLVIALGTATGAEIFKLRLPEGKFDPEPIQEVAGLFLVQTGEAPGGVGDSLLIDRHGKVKHRFNRQVVAGSPQGEDRVFLPTTDVVRVSPDGESRWKTPLKRRYPVAGGGLLPVNGGVIAFRYSRITDSGVEAVRLDVDTGEVAWRASCSLLGNSDSYYRHEATAAVEGSTVRVTSWGSWGTFVELLDVRTGRLLKRTRLEPEVEGGP